MGRGLECGHYCHPSAPQLWVHALYGAMQLHVVPMASRSAEGRTDPAAQRTEDVSTAASSRREGGISALSHSILNLHIGVVKNAGGR